VIVLRWVLDWMAEGIEECSPVAGADVDGRRSVAFKRAEDGGGQNRAVECFRAEQPFKCVTAWPRRCGADDTGWKESSIAGHVPIPGWRPDQHMSCWPLRRNTLDNCTHTIALTRKEIFTAEACL
jgi:hypothetical protein